MAGDTVPTALLPGFDLHPPLVHGQGGSSTLTTRRASAEQALSYDSIGNLTDGTNTYTWDARNYLTGIAGG